MNTENKEGKIHLKTPQSWRHGKHSICVVLQHNQPSKKYKKQRYWEICMLYRFVQTKQNKPQSIPVDSAK
jgi:hypothetical protein